jgi:hypothetical protein
VTVRDQPSVIFEEGRVETVLHRFELLHHLPKGGTRPRVSLSRVEKDSRCFPEVGFRLGRWAESRVQGREFKPRRRPTVAWKIENDGLLIVLRPIYQTFDEWEQQAREQNCWWCFKDHNPALDFIRPERGNYSCHGNYEQMPDGRIVPADTACPAYVPVAVFDRATRATAHAELWLDCWGIGDDLPTSYNLIVRDPQGFSYQRLGDAFEIILEWVLNPAATGRPNCCFCDRPLADPDSRRLGYGPDCARAYGLPHGPNHPPMSIGGSGVARL